MLRHHGQLATLGANHTALDKHHVAQVNEVLPLGERFLAHLGEAEHDLQRGAVAILQGGEGQLAGVADEHHATGNAHDLVGFLAGGEPYLLGVAVVVVFIIDATSLSLVAVLFHTPGGADLRQCVGARHFHGVGILAGVQDALALLAPDAELFWNVGSWGF